LSQTRIRRAGPWPGWIRRGLRVAVPGSRRLHHRAKHSWSTAAPIPARSAQPCRRRTIR